MPDALTIATTAHARLWRWRFVRFLAVGALNTLFGYGAFYLLLSAHLAPTLALALATVLGVAFNFFTTGRVVFGDSGAARLWRFASAYGLVFVVNAALLEAARRWGFAPASAQALLLAPCVALSYVVNRTLVFGPVREVQET